LINALVYFDSRTYWTERVLIIKHRSDKYLFLKKRRAEIPHPLNLISGGDADWDFFKGDFAVVGASAVDVSTSNIPRLHEEGSIVWLELFFLTCLVPFRFLLAFKASRFTALIKLFAIIGLTRLSRLSWLLMVGNNVTRQ